MLNDLTFTYAYLIENYGSLIIKALEGGGGGGCFLLPVGFWLITSEVQSFLTGNFMTNSIKISFLDSSFQYFPIDLKFTWFRGGPNFAFFCNYVICYCLAFKSAYFVERNICYQTCKFQLFRMSGSNFTEWGLVPSSSTVPGEKSPVLLGLKCKNKLPVSLKFIHSI